MICFYGIRAATACKVVTGRLVGDNKALGVLAKPAEGCR